ncbi:MAG TPA: signal peptidase I [Ginsengibacter sp.]
MKKFAIVTGICIAALITAWLTCRLTGMLNYFSIATASNEPTLRKNTIVFGSNLKKPRRFDFIFYKHLGNEPRSSIYIFRLCGLPGDKVQLINGVLFVNDQNTESLFGTYHNYIINNNDLERIRDDLKLEDEQVNFIANDTIEVPLEKSAIKDYSITATFCNPGDIDNEIFKTYHKKWTPDNFGPLVVPDNSYFVLGDNRSEAYDSRYTGCVSQGEYIGTKLGSR